MSSVPDPIHAQLVVARRNQILDAATKVFAAKGFHPTTIKDIAREADIAHGTIYNYFENKTALMLGIFDRLNETDQRDEDLSKFSAGDFRSFMKGYLRHRLTVLQAGDFEVFRVVVSEIMVNKELRELFYRKILEPTFAMADVYFQQWMAQHIVKPIDSGLTMRAISGMVLGIIMERILGDQTLASKWDDLPDFITNIIMDGLALHQEVTDHDNSTN